MDMEDVFVDAPWGKIATVLSGNPNGSPVLMLHGNLDTASTFFPLIKLFPKELQLIMMELPSCGKSTPFPGGLPIQLMDFVPCMKLVVEHFKLEKFMFLAHSMGTQIGLLYHEVYPDQITRIIALDHMAYPAVELEQFSMLYKYLYESYYDPSNFKRFTSGTNTNPLYTYEKALSVITQTRKLTREAGEAVLERALIPAENGLYRFCWDQRLKNIVIPIFTKDFQVKYYGRINIPHLLVFASESIKDRIGSLRLHVLYVQAKNPNFRVTMVEGCHDVHLNSPEVIARIVVPFLMGQDHSKKDSEATVRQLKKIFDKTKTRRSKL